MWSGVWSAFNGARMNMLPSRMIKACSVLAISSKTSSRPTVRVRQAEKLQGTKRPRRPSKHGSSELLSLNIYIYIILL